MAKVYFDGHSTCRISDNINIWIDPFYSGNPLCTSDWRSLDKPDVVLVTHGHGDHIGDAIEIVKETNAMLGCTFELAAHCAAQGVPTEQILNQGMGWNVGGTVEYKNNHITMHSAEHTCPYGVATSFAVTTASGFTFYHAGDTGIFSSMELIGQLHSIDLAMLPIGDVFTMGATQAALACKLLNAKSVMPMHYKTMPVLAQSTKDFENELKRLAPNCSFFELEPNANREYIK